MENNRKHKFTKNNTYFTISVYTVITISVSAILIKAIWNWAETMKTFNKIVEMLTPFLIGVFIAYMLNPVVKLMDKWFFGKLLRIRKKIIRKFFSILVTYIIVIGVIIMCIYYIIPEVYTSLKNIYEGVQGNYDKLLKFLDKMSKKHPDMDITYITNIAKDNSSNVINFIQGSVNTILPLLYNTSVSVITWTINIIIAIMVSCYMLIDKERLLLTFKKLLYAIVKKEKADNFVVLLKDCNRIFSNFIIGKAIDSLIIGFMCFGFMKILRLDYAVLISVIVGITNMIPYFGPYIGAVPGILILLTTSWRQALVFSIMILILQQFDGIYLGPKILGESIGIRPVWIIFAITVGGYLAGPIGMFLGVPCVGVIAFLIDRFVERRLKERKIEVE